jgi:acyl carrier protein
MSLLMSVGELIGVKVSGEEAKALSTRSDLGQLIAERRA